MEALAASSGQPTGGLTSPDYATKAIQMLEYDEVCPDDGDKLDAIAAFQRDPRANVTYLAIQNKALRSKWLQRQIVAERAANSIKFGLLPLM